MPDIPRPLTLIVMDGYGINPRTDANAVALARKPNLDAHRAPLATHAAGHLWSGGGAAGGADGQLGGGPPEHRRGQACLAGVHARVSAAIHDGSFFENPALLQPSQQVKRNGSKLHLCGLIGDGGVHAHQSHLYACLRLAAAHGVERVYIHAFTDGRDTSPFGAQEYMKELLAQALEIERRASGAGRHDLRPLLRDGPRQPLGPHRARLLGDDAR